MAQVNAGRVRFVGRGEYDNSTQYYTFDLVNYNGNSYFAKSNTMGNLPTNSTYWQLVAEKGNTGDTGATGNGIASITKTSTSGLVDTYTITYTSGNTTTFNVTNGNGIDHISLTSQSGATKVYTIYFTDGNTTTFTVEDGEVTQEVFDEEIERANMIYNVMPKVSGEGTDLTLNNTAECPVYDIELSPSELEQATTSGKNLMPTSLELMKSLNTTGTWNNDVYTLNGVTWTPVFKNNELQYVNANGTASGDSTFSIGRLENPENNQYTGTGCPANGSTSTYRMFFSNMGSEVGDGITRTITDKTQINCSATVYDGYSASNLVYYPMLRLSSVTDATYEPYTNGASPNPQYPQEIHTVSGDNTINIKNINILSNKLEDWDLALRYYGGQIIATGNTHHMIAIPIRHNTTYILQKWGDALGINVGLTHKFPEVGDTELALGASMANRTTYTINNTDYNYILLFYYSSSAEMTEDKLEDYSVTINNSLENYVPYTIQSLPLSLGDLEYCKIGDYEDLFFKNVVGSEYYDSTLELNKWYLKKNIGKVVLTGGSNESWTKGTTVNTDYSYFRSTSYDNIISDATYLMWCQYFGQPAQYLTPSYITDKSVISGANTAGDTRIRILVPNSLNATTIEQWRNWLSTHNTPVYCVLATPTYTLLSDTLQTQLDNIQKAITYQEQTNVSQTNNDLPFVIKLSAIRDLSGIFELIQ